jgi:hypothetical protein
MLLHDWADEWNVVYYYGSPNREHFFMGWSEFIRRFQRRHPDAPQLTAWCTEHRDNIYVWGPRTDAPPAAPRR